VDDREQCDRARRWSWFIAERRLDRLELAAGRAVDDVPPAFAQPLANRISGIEVALPPVLDALFEKPLSLLLIRSSWL
jgi:hypothetical protein